MMWYTGNGWGWWMAFGWIWMLVFWGLIIWGVYSLTAHLRGDNGTRTSGESTALEILERRYASGQLSHDEFEEMRQRLTRPGSPISATGRGGDGGQAN